MVIFKEQAKLQIQKFKITAKKLDKPLNTVSIALSVY